MEVPRRASAGPWTGLAAAGLAVAVILAASAFIEVAGSAGSSSTPSVRAIVTNQTGALGQVFHPGAILSGGSNQSVTLLGGIGVYQKPSDFSLPVLSSAAPGSGPLQIVNLTPLANHYFWKGGIYSIVWNGSAWLLTGQAGWGGSNIGSAILLQGARLTNLTPLVGPEFPGGGIWTSGWNGTAWLMGGNSTAGPVLLSLDGGRLTDLSVHLESHDSRNWLQYLGWNGREWLLAGEGILGLLQGAAYIDLFPQAPDAGSGLYSGGWNGSAWLAGGGGGRTSLIEGTVVSAGPPLPHRLDQSVLAIEPVRAGWVIGGKGTASDGSLAAGLAYWNGRPGAPSITDLSSSLPSSFREGEIWGAVPVPGSALPSFYVVGFGSYNSTTGFSLGALAQLTLAPGSSLGLSPPGARQIAGTGERSVPEGGRSAPRDNTARLPGIVHARTSAPGTRRLTPIPIAERERPGK